MSYVLKKDIEKEYIINKSKFIVVLKTINDLDNIDNFIKEIKSKYKNATHYCYAYILDGAEKCSDDKEPSGTAGLPILNVLKKNNLNNILCVVVRYFGGIKLGAGGLVRAYSNTVSDTINMVGITEKINYKNIKITFDYNKIKDVEHILNECKITNKIFDNNVIFEVSINEDIYDEIIEKLNNIGVNKKNM